MSTTERHTMSTFTTTRYVVASVRHRPGVGGYVVLDGGTEVFAGTFAECHRRQGELIAAWARGESLWHVAYAIPGYLPNLDEEAEPIRLADLDAYLSDELSRAADSAEESAHALAEGHDYVAAWREHERAEKLSTLAQNVSPKRREAPLYVNYPDRWIATLDTIVRETFPVYVSEHEALYVWEVERDA